MSTLTETKTRWRDPLICLALIAMTWIVFYQVWEFEFVDFSIEHPGQVWLPILSVLLHDLFKVTV